MKPLLTQLWPQFNADPAFAAGFAGALVERVVADRKNRTVTIVFSTCAPIERQMKERLAVSLEPLFEGFAVKLQGRFPYAMLTPNAVLDLSLIHI